MHADENLDFKQGLSKYDYEGMVISHVANGYG